jgi:hypothetical protein
VCLGSCCHTVQPSSPFCVIVNVLREGRAVKHRLKTFKRGCLACLGRCCTCIKLLVHKVAKTRCFNNSKKRKECLVEHTHADSCFSHEHLFKCTDHVLSRRGFFQILPRGATSNSLVGFDCRQLVQGKRLLHVSTCPVECVSAYKMHRKISKIRFFLHK